MNWFTADLHFTHDNIIKYTGRPFKDWKVMDRELVRNLRECVDVEDTLYIIGDFSILNASRWAHLEKITAQIPGRKVLVLGNHDYLNPFKYVEMGFQSVHTSLNIQVDGHNLILNHDPAAFCMLPKDCIFLCGHIHTLFKVLPEERTVNVGVDVWDFKPVNLDMILDALGE